MYASVPCGKSETTLARAAKPISQYVVQYSMVKCIKRSAEIQQHQHEAGVRRTYEVILNADDGGFDRMVLSIGWLARRKKTACVGWRGQPDGWLPASAQRFSIESWGLKLVGRTLCQSSLKKASWVEDGRSRVLCVWKTTLCKRCIGHGCGDRCEYIT